MVDDEGLSRRIAEIVSRAGGARVLGERADLSPSTIGNWASGQTTPKAVDLLRLARAANCSVAWIMTGLGPSTGAADGYREAVAQIAGQTSGLRENAPAYRFEEGDAFLPVCRHDIRVSAGDGLTAVEPLDDLPPLAFRGSWLRRTVSSLENAALVSVRGDSMAPLIQDADLLLVDRGARSPIAGGLFVLRIGDDVVVKRLAPASREGWLRITSENTELYPAYDSAAEDVHIIGRVRWIGRSL